MSSKIKDIDIYKQRIKKNGFRLTGTRMIILETLLENPGELNAEELFFLSHKKNPGIGQATIYRNLKLLEKEGLVEKTGYKDNKANYRIMNNPDSILKDAESKLVKGGSYINNKRKDTKNKPAGDIGHLSDTGYGSSFKSYMDIEKIDAIQSQLTEWLSDLNKIKREKEFALEDVIKDFGKVDKIVSHHKNQRSSLIQILLDVQNEYRWLPKHVLLYISNKLEVSLTNIYDITTFYKYFNLEPRGRHSITVCMGTACHIRGAMNLLQRITNILEINPGDTTSDYNFTLDTVNCLGCCALGPVVMVDKKYFSNPSVGELKKILKQFY